MRLARGHECTDIPSQVIGSPLPIVGGDVGDFFQRPLPFSDTLSQFGTVDHGESTAEEYRVQRRGLKVDRPRVREITDEAVE